MSRKLNFGEHLDDDIPKLEEVYFGSDVITDKEVIQLIGMAIKRRRKLLEDLDIITLIDLEDRILDVDNDGVREDSRNLEFDDSVEGVVCYVQLLMFLKGDLGASFLLAFYTNLRNS